MLSAALFINHCTSNLLWKYLYVVIELINISFPHVIYLWITCRAVEFQVTCQDIHVNTSLCCCFHVYRFFFFWSYFLNIPSMCNAQCFKLWPINYRLCFTSLDKHVSVVDLHGSAHNIQPGSVIPVHDLNWTLVIACPHISFHFMSLTFKPIHGSCAQQSAFLCVTWMHQTFYNFRHIPQSKSVRTDNLMTQTTMSLFIAHSFLTSLRLSVLSTWFLHPVQ